MAFEQGRTGYPLLDACMRCLLQTGWINFRMRCMLVSFAVYNLWLDWRCIASHLARCFLDYEPGIHYPQLQMQAGTTGCDMRCYSMSRQAKDQDPNGDFIRRYVKELAHIPGALALEPWKLPGGLPEGYPTRIVDEVKTSKASKDAIGAFQKWFQARNKTREPPPLTELVEQKPKHRRLGSQDVGAMLLQGGKPTWEAEAKELMPSNGSGRNLAASGDPHVCSQLVETPSQVSKALSTWTCPCCTLLNSLMSCEACETPAPSAVATREHPQAMQSQSVMKEECCVVIDLD